MSNKYKELALDYCYAGKAELTGLRPEEITLVLKYVNAYKGNAPSKVFVPKCERKFIINCETLTELIEAAMAI
nr:MAG: hypothetical protein [Microvirus Sku111]